MKKFNLFLFTLMMPILFLVSCDSEPSVTNAAFRIQEILEREFSPNCVFDNGAIKGEEEYKDNYLVYQKFNIEKYGNERHYIFKAKLEYLGDDPYEESAWNIKSLLVEDIDNGEKWYLK